MRNLSELKAYLGRLGTDAKRTLSQNFLIDANLIQKIVTTAGLTPASHVLEIGPGCGALTENLVHAAASVTAVEFDDILAKELGNLPVPDSCRFNLVHADFLKVDLDTLIQPPCVVVANIPYHISGPILERIFLRPDLFTHAVIMIQTELAERLVAKPGDKTYSGFSALMQTFCDVKIAFKVPKSCFYPAPSIDSSVIHMTLRPARSAALEKALQREITAAFAHRRKQLQANLSYGSDVVKRELEALHINPLVRAEALSWQQLEALITACEAAKE